MGQDLHATELCAVLDCQLLLAQPCYAEAYQWADRRQISQCWGKTTAAFSVSSGQIYEPPPSSPPRPQPRKAGCAHLYGGGARPSGLPPGTRAAQPRARPSDLAQLLDTELGAGNLAHGRMPEEKHRPSKGRAESTVGDHVRYQVQHGSVAASSSTPTSGTKARVVASTPCHTCGRLERAPLKPRRSWLALRTPIA